MRVWGRAAQTQETGQSISLLSLINRGVRLMVMKRHGSPAVIVTDGLKSYPAAMRELGNLECREMGRWLNNRVENSNLPF